MERDIRQQDDALPAAMRRELAAARAELGWSQAELARRVGLTQAHISHLETGKTTPRIDTLLDLARVLGRDVVLVRRELAAVVESLGRERRNGAEERPLYGPDEDDGAEREA